MKIEDKRTGTGTRFIDIAYGELFQYQEVIYMKIQTDCGSPRAVFLSSGRLFYPANDFLVIPVRGRVILENS